MKLFTKGMSIAMLSLIATASFAQSTQAKQKIFDAFPQTINVANTLLSNATNYTKGSIVTLDLLTGFQFTGTVFYNEKKYDNLQTIMIRSTENPKSVFEISKITKKDNSIAYVGRIMNNDAADGYEIKNNNGSYSLQKFETQKIIEECK